MIKLFLSFGLCTLLSNFGLCVEETQPKEATAQYAPHTTQPQHITTTVRDVWGIIISKLPLQSPTERSFSSLKQTCKFLEEICNQPTHVHNAHRDSDQCERVLTSNQANGRLLGRIFDAWRYFRAFQPDSKPFLNDQFLMDKHIPLILMGISLKHDGVTRYLIGRYFYLQPHESTDNRPYMPPSILDRNLYHQLKEIIQNTITYRQDSQRPVNRKFIDDNLSFLHDIFYPKIKHSFNHYFFEHAPLYGFSTYPIEFGKSDIVEGSESGISMFYTYFLVQNNPRLSVLQFWRSNRSVTIAAGANCQDSSFCILDHLIGKYKKLISENPRESVLYNSDSFLFTILDAGNISSFTELMASQRYPVIKRSQAAASNDDNRNLYFSVVEKLLKLNPSSNIATRYLEDQKLVIERTSAHAMRLSLSPYALLALYVSARKMGGDVGTVDFWESYFNSSILSQTTPIKKLNQFNIFSDYGFKPSLQVATHVLQTFIEHRAAVCKNTKSLGKLTQAGDLKYSKFQLCGVDFVQLGSFLGPKKNFLNFCCNSQMVVGEHEFYRDLLRGIRKDHYADRQVYWNNGGETPLYDLVQNLEITTWTTKHFIFICKTYPEWASLPDLQGKLPLMHIINRYFNSDLIWKQQVPANVALWIEHLVNGVTNVDVLINLLHIVTNSKFETTPRLQGAGIAVQNARKKVMNILKAAIDALHAQRVAQNEKRVAPAEGFVERASKRQELEVHRTQE